MYLNISATSIFHVNTFDIFGFNQVQDYVPEYLRIISLCFNLENKN